MRQSGIVGLGGAAFPLWAKLDAIRKGPIKTVLINGAECEPFITSDHRTMVEHSDLVVKGVALLKEYLHSEEFILGIENNKPDAIAEMQRVFAGDPSVVVKPLKSVYPQGAKQVLLYNAAGLVVGEGQRLASLGYIIINVTSLAKMAEYIETGMPLVSRCLTVDGSAIKEPKNLEAPIGTRISYLVEACGGLKEEAGKVIFGGPMMGKTAYSMEQPIVKATNAIVVMNRKEAAALTGHPLHVCEVFSQLQAPVYIARVSVADTKRIMQTKAAIRRVFEIQRAHKGYALLEILAPCPTNLRMDAQKSAAFCMNEMEREFPLGTFRDVEKGVGVAESAAAVESPVLQVKPVPQVATCAGRGRWRGCRRRPRRCSGSP